ncbi:MAG: ABC transporter ATP-binding protein/permease, partial [Chloroflexota bacterium]|nr:ABC transporter ATP-binding protein/permease [Chloroflexota bacterium]
MRPGAAPGGASFFGGRGPMAMGMPTEKPKDFRGTLMRLLGYFRPQKYRLIVVVLAAILSTIFSIVAPKIMGLATTKLFAGIVARMRGVPGAGVDFAYIRRILVLLVVLYVISAAFGYAQQFIMASVAQRTVYRMRREVDEKFARLPLKFFDSRTHGEILSRAVNDMDNISSTLQQSLTQLITSLVTVAGVIVMMFLISPVLALVVLTTLPLSLLSTRWIAKRSQRYFIGQQRSLGQLNGHVEEMYTGHKIVKAFGQERQSVARFDALNGELYESGWKAQFVSGIIMPMTMFIGNLGYVFVSIVGGIMVTRRAIAIGDVQAFIQYARQFSMPITQLANIANIIQSTMASAERVFELLDEAEEMPDAADAVVVAQRQGAVRFEHVRFGYDLDTPLIADMNIDVRPGQVIAIVGPTGAGKTTLVNLLMRFYEIDGGAIRVDGENITDLRRGALRRQFGMVLQDTWLFKGTIRENIAYGREGATEDEIVQAARAARADHFIRTLPDGYETILNEEASNISQGQKQLLTIARAILADPAILILDEATSSVDTRTEMAIQRAMVELMQGRTSFVIAHRLSTIRDADLILVMNHGSIVEQGTHEELLVKNGFYADLYNSQFTGGARQLAAVS